MQDKSKVHQITTKAILSLWMVTLQDKSKVHQITTVYGFWFCRLYCKTNPKCIKSQRKLSYKQVARNCKTNPKCIKSQRAIGKRYLLEIARQIQSASNHNTEGLRNGSVELQDKSKVHQITTSSVFVCLPSALQDKSKVHQITTETQDGFKQGALQDKSKVHQITTNGSTTCLTG